MTQMPHNAYPIQPPQELQPTPEQLAFYSDLYEIEPVYERISNLTREDIEIALRLRRNGPPQLLSTNLLNEGLTAWHVEAGKLVTLGERTFHELGLLYGSIMCNDYYASVMGQRLAADDPEAYGLAIKMMRDASYSYLLHNQMSVARTAGDVEPPRWWVERFRELENTGSDVFTIMNAMMHDGVRYKVQQISGEIPESKSIVPFLTGLVDAKIFFRNYINFRQNKYIVPSFEFISAADAPISLGDQPFRLQPADTIPEVLRKLQRDRTDVGWYNFEFEGNFFQIMTEAQVVQTGANLFERMHRVEYAAIPGGPENIDAWEETAQHVKHSLYQWRHDGFMRPVCELSELQRSAQASIAAASTRWRIIAPPAND